MTKNRKKMVKDYFKWHRQKRNLKNNMLAIKDWRKPKQKNFLTLFNQELKKNALPKDSDGASCCWLWIQFKNQRGQCNQDDVSLASDSVKIEKKKKILTFFLCIFSQFEPPTHNFKMCTKVLPRIFLLNCIHVNFVLFFTFSFYNKSSFLY